MIKNWELKIKENKSTLIINDCGVKFSDIINLARHLVIKFHLDRLYIKSHNDIDIRFEDGTIIEHLDFRDFCKGKIANPNLTKRKSWKDVRITNIQWDASDDVMVGLPDKVNALDLIYLSMIQTKIWIITKISYMRFQRLYQKNMVSVMMVSSLKSAWKKLYRILAENLGQL